MGGLAECQRRERASHSPRRDRQEVPEIVAWIKQQPDLAGDPRPWHPLIAQDGLEMYFFFFEYDQTWMSLLVTFQVGAYGLNLHHCCHRVIIAETPKNLSTLWQATGRVNRIGQLVAQFIWILSQASSVERYLDWNNAVKAIPQVAGEGRLRWAQDLEVAMGRAIKEAENAQRPEEGPLSDADKDALRGEAERDFLDYAAAQTIQRMLGQRES